LAHAVYIPRVKAIVDVLEELDITIHWFLGRNLAAAQAGPVCSSAFGPNRPIAEGQSMSALPLESDINLFRYRERVVDLDA
jgi:hypothetical protein